MQAEMVLKKMSEISLTADSSSGSLSTSLTSPSANNNNNANNNQAEPDFANNNEVSTISHR